jgi:hypothetical protein
MSQYSDQTPNQTTNFRPKANIHNEMKSYINLASHGHFPLFFKEWLAEGVTNQGPMSFQVANRNVRETFKKLSCHRTQQKKKTALIGLQKDEREVFVKSFIKVVEHGLLKDLKTLH